MRLTITIDCDNAAFGETYDDAALECGRMLSTIGGNLQDQLRYSPADRDYPFELRDTIDGHPVGKLKWTGLPKKWLKERTGGA